MLGLDGGAIKMNSGHALAATSASFEGTVRQAVVSFLFAAEQAGGVVYVGDLTIIDENQTEEYEGRDYGEDKHRKDLGDGGS
jgi:hypothetical protein